MRGDTVPEAFVKYVLGLRNGYLPKSDFSEIELPKDIISSAISIEEVFRDCLPDQNFD